MQPISARPATDPVPAKDRPTEQQARVFAYVYNLICAEGRQPSLREISEHLGYASPNGAWCHVLALGRKGWLEASGRSRSAKLLRNLDGSPWQGLVPKS